MESNHIEWLNRITQGDSHRTIAANAGISAATLSRQARAGELAPELIIDIAQAYDESPVYALVDFGFISARWISEPGALTALTRATDEQLTNELLRRLRLLEDVPVDELASRRSNSGTPDVEGLPYSADACNTGRSWETCR